MDPAHRGVDEDEGSPLQNGANVSAHETENREISGSPPGTP